MVYDGATMVATGQSVKPAGKSFAFAGRPVDMVFSTDRKLLFIKAVHGLVIADPDSMSVQQSLPFDKKSGGSMHGITASPDGKHVYLTASGSLLFEASLNDSSKWYWSRHIEMPATDKGDSYPCGLAVSRDGTRAYVALSRNNSVAIVDIAAERILGEIAAGAAPFDVLLSPDETALYVSNWGGRKPSAGERVMKSTGTDILVDERGIPTSGTVSKVDLRSRCVIAEVTVGLHPSGMTITHNGSYLFVANANSDNVSAIECEAFNVIESIGVRPDSSLPFGSITNAVALSPDERTLYAANGGNNALAVVSLKDGVHSMGKYITMRQGSRLADTVLSLKKEVHPPSTVLGFVPTGWFPAAVVTRGQQIFVANTKGEGSRQADSTTHKWYVKWHRGIVSRIENPTPAALSAYTKQVRDLSRIQTSLEEFKPLQSNTRARPAPVPRRSGEPSVFEHVVYVLKENRTYDQVFGDMKEGNNDPDLCIFGRDVSPNHHAIASQFVLLDNYYCSGIVSADGHQWATQGITTDYQEKAWGTWTRSYDFGTDPLAFAPTDFIWDNALLHGRSFRNYGEFDFPAVEPESLKWSAVYDYYRNKRGGVDFRPSLPLEPLRQYTCPNYPGWNLRIPDVLRLDRFMKEFEEYQKKGEWPNLVFVYLPQDHTSGMKADAPTPRAHVADNDLALGKLIEAISRSRFWPTTCIFVNEDDPCDGFDHVDGHRSICLVVSPYTKRGKVVSTFYNQASVLHTIERILGLPPMNQLDAMAPTMENCFMPNPDLTPYTALPNIVPLDEMNKHASNFMGEEYRDQKMTERFDFSGPDRIDDNLLNRILWFAAKGPGHPYPARFAGAHGSGLKALHLKLMNGGLTDAED